MSFIRDLIAKGVSQAGAVEVLLGEPLSMHSDRLILSQLAVPIARDSLSQLATSKYLVRAADQRVNQIVSAMSGTSVASTYMTMVVQRTQTTTTRPADPQLEQRINALKNSIKNVEREIQNLTAQLLRLAVPPPGMPQQAWEATVRLLRNLIRSMKSVLASLMKQLSDLGGESGSSAGSSAGGSAGGAASSSMNSANQAYSDLQNTNKDSNSGSTGGGGA